MSKFEGVISASYTIAAYNLTNFIEYLMDPDGNKTSIDMFISWKLIQ